MFRDFLVWFFHDAFFFMTMGMLFIMKTLEDERYIVIKAYKLTVLRNYYVLHVCAILTYRVYQLNDRVNYATSRAYQEAGSAKTKIKSFAYIIPPNSLLVRMIKVS